MKIDFGHIEIFCKDTVKSKDFYEQTLGFEVIEIQHGKFVWMKLGDKTILLRPASPITDNTGSRNSEKEYKQTNTGIVLYTKELEGTKEELINRGLKFKGTDGSDECLTFTDPDGHWFQLVNPDHA